MRTIKSLLSVTAGSLAICLQLGYSTALAQEICLDDDTVIGIKGLEVVTDQYGIIDIDVDFRYTTGIEIYGSDLDNLPFDQPFADEDVFATSLAINNALDANNPVPVSAGQPGQNAYFIGAEKDTENGKLVVLAAGNENLTGNFWDACTSASDCFGGVAILEVDERVTYADLSRASGSSCDSGGPPPPTFTITPGITGSWYDPERDGEGYNIEIIGSSLEPQLLAYFYTYDEVGNQMYLVGSGPVDGDSAVVPVVVTSGPVYGDGYDKDDVVRESWGTLTFKFSSCNTGSVERASTMGFGTTTEDVIRLTSVTGLTCP